MSFPVPVDARAARDFEVVKGMDEMIRTSLPLADATKAVAEGEWVKTAVSGGVAKAAKCTAADDSTNPAMGARCSWSKHDPASLYTGQPDVHATKTIDVLSGTFEAKTKLYDGAGDYTSGNILVVVHHAGTDRGILKGFLPAAVTLLILQAAVGRVISEASSVLYFASPAL